MARPGNPGIGPVFAALVNFLVFQRIKAGTECEFSAVHSQIVAVNAQFLLEMVILKDEFPPLFACNFTADCRNGAVYR